MVRRICALTERRADYSKLRPVLRKIIESPAFDLRLIVAGHHLLPELGLTVHLIENDGFPIAARVPMSSGSDKDSGADMARALGRGLVEFTDVLEDMRPDIMLVGFDLGAHLAAAVAAAHMNIPVAHIEGGELTGSIDESLRHATTRFAHLHFATNRASAERLIRMGENPRYVFNVGCPSLDALLNMDFVRPETLARQFDLDLSQPLIVVLQHAVTTEADEATGQIMLTLDAVKKTGVQAILIYPNVDAGGRRIIREIEKTRIQAHKNLPFEVYGSLMKVASVLVGNSSSGIVEAPALHLPAVNIGTRQQGRMQAGNVINAGYDSQDIFQAITKAICDAEFRERLASCTSPYGDGKASARIAEILKSVDLEDHTLIQKRLSY
ncbi:MAG: UDP-N-acetylglucosamine 2-epimerase (hydrolyzing) [Chloroflexi bacterium]|nr:UDP-N-acetylglucosamine 2-epimerase (hydrolyzing) [Chloroflexota bacterium]